MIDSFVTAWHSLVRGKVLLLLSLSAALVWKVLPSFVRADGTVEGLREMYLRSLPGAVFAIVFLSLLCCACGWFARERETGRLALSIVRPASAVSQAVGTWLAFVAVAALVLFLSCVAEAFLPGAPEGVALDGICYRHVRPCLPSPEEEARALLPEYLKRTDLPEEVHKTSRSQLLTTLAARAADRYDSVAKGVSFSWPFTAAEISAEDPTVRVKFSTQFNQKSVLKGVFAIGGVSCVVSNATESVLDIPLKGKIEAKDGGKIAFLEFTNEGEDSVMLRPRADLEILVKGDSVYANLARSFFEQVFLVALVVAFGLFLSSAVSRPVAVFTALVIVFVVSVAGDAFGNGALDYDATTGERIGWWMSRAVSLATDPLVSPCPIADFATNTGIPVTRVLKTFAVDFLAVPFALLSCAGILLRLKPR